MFTSRFKKRSAWECSGKLGNHEAEEVRIRPDSGDAQ